MDNPARYRLSVSYHDRHRDFYPSQADYCRGFLAMLIIGIGLAYALFR